MQPLVERALPCALRPQSPREALGQRPDAVRIRRLPGPWRLPPWQAVAWQWLAEPADERQWAARNEAGEQSCAAPAWLELRAEARRRQPPELDAPEPRQASLPDAAAYGSAEPLLPLPVSWPGWPSARRRAWRYAIDQSWALCPEGRVTPVCLPGSRTAFHAQNARVPCRPHRFPGNWSGSCPWPGRALPICQEPAGS